MTLCASSSVQAKVGPETEGPTVTLRPGGKLKVEVVNQKTRPVLIGVLAELLELC